MARVIKKVYKAKLNPYVSVRGGTHLSELVRNKKVYDMELEVTRCNTKKDKPVYYQITEKTRQLLQDKFGDLYCISEYSYLLKISEANLELQLDIELVELKI